MSTPQPAEVLAEAQESLLEQGRAALCQIVRTEGSTPGKVGWKLLVRPDGSCYGNLGGGAFEALVTADAKAKLAARCPSTEVKRYYLTEKAVRGEPTGMVCGGLVEVFLEVLIPKPLLVVCGGGPVGQAIAQNGVLCQFEVLVADDRREFRDPSLFPAGTAFAAVSRDYREPFLHKTMGRDLFIAVVTRCWETDLAALGSILRQKPEGIRYLGLMGSQRKVDRVRQELASQGFDFTGLNFFAPIGLPIGGDQPGEIAVSILAEMIQCRTGTSTETTPLLEYAEQD
jgi:xanthine dehydrogenase accessory factor